MDAMGVLAFILTALVVPGFPAGALVPRFAFMAVAVWGIILWRQVDIPAAVWWLLLVLAAQVALYPFVYDGIGGWLQVWLLAGVFCLGRTVTDLRPVWVGAALALWLNSVAVTLQFWGWTEIPQLSAHAGLFFNRNMGVEAAAMVTAGLVYESWKTQRWYPAWLCIGFAPTFLAGARAPVVALSVAAVVATVFQARSRVFPLPLYVHRFRILMILLLTTLVLAVLWSQNSAALTSIQERYNLWWDVLVSLRPWPHGLGLFEVTFPFYQVHTNGLSIRFDHAHNDFLQVTYELGAGGALAAGYFIYRLACAGRSAAWYAAFVFLVECCFGFPLAMPVTGFLFALCAGHMLGAGRLVRVRHPAFGLAGGPRLSDREHRAVHQGGGAMAVYADQAHGAGLLHAGGAIAARDDHSGLEGRS